MITDNVLYLSSYVRSAPKDNIVSNILTSVVADYNNTLSLNKVDVEDPTIAFDIATIQFLLHGMAHRSQGETHPSQIILNTLRAKMLGF